MQKFNFSVQEPVYKGADKQMPWAAMGMTGSTWCVPCARHLGIFSNWEELESFKLPILTSYNTDP